MSKKIEFKFALGERVKIFETKSYGTITGLFYGIGEIKHYLVKYKDRNGAMFEQYFTTQELRKK